MVNTETSIILTIYPSYIFEMLFILFILVVWLVSIMFSVIFKKMWHKTLNMILSCTIGIFCICFGIIGAFFLYHPAFSTFFIIIGAGLLLLGILNLANKRRLKSNPK